MKSLKVEWPEWLNQPFLRSRRRRYKRRCTLTCTAHFVGPHELMNWFSWMRRWRKKPGWFPKLDISYYLLGDFSDSLFMFWLQLWHNIHLYPLNLKNPFCGPLPNKTSPSKTVYHFVSLRYVVFDIRIPVNPNLSICSIMNDAEDLHLILSFHQWNVKELRLHFLFKVTTMYVSGTIQDLFAFMNINLIHLAWFGQINWVDVFKIVYFRH